MIELMYGVRKGIEPDLADVHFTGLSLRSTFCYPFSRYTNTAGKQFTAVC